MSSELLDIYTNYLICQNQYATATGLCVKGVNILSGLIRYDDFALPVAFEAIRKDIHFCDIETKKEKRKSSKTKNKLLHGMLQQSVNNGLKFDYVLADNWFGLKTCPFQLSYSKKFSKTKTSLNHFALKYKLIVRANQITYQELLEIRSSA